jgi:hypothetical protein
LRGKFDAAAGLVAVGAALLFVSLFVRWFRPGGDAWQVFELVDVVLLAAALAGLVEAFADPLRFPGLGRSLPLIAAAAVVLVAVQGIEPPPAAQGASREAGFWIALGGALLMAGGAALSAAHIAVTVDVRERVRRAAIDARRPSEDPEEPEEREEVVEPPPPLPADDEPTRPLGPEERV